MKLFKRLLFTTIILLTELLLMSWIFVTFQKGILLSKAGNTLISYGYVIIDARNDNTGRQVHKFISREGGDLLYQPKGDRNNEFVKWKRL